MNADRFDAYVRSMSHVLPRRTLVRALTGGGLTLLGWTKDPSEAAAKKKGKKKRKKRKSQSQALPPPPLAPLVFNRYGCVEVGQPCRGDGSLCCSGVCQGAAPTEGQPDTSQCAAHNTGMCAQGIPGACTTPDLLSVVCNNRTDCGCLRTTAGSNVCAELFGGAGFSQCVANCRRDADCVALGFPAGSACAAVSEGRCAGTCSSGMACLVPCGPTRPPSQQM